MVVSAASCSLALVELSYTVGLQHMNSVIQHCAVENLKICPQKSKAVKSNHRFIHASSEWMFAPFLDQQIFFLKIEKSKRKLNPWLSLCSEELWGWSLRQNSDPTASSGKSLNTCSSSDHPLSDTETHTDRRLIFDALMIFTPTLWGYVCALLYTDMLLWRVCLCAVTHCLYLCMNMYVCSRMKFALYGCLFGDSQTKTQSSCRSNRETPCGCEIQPPHLSVSAVPRAVASLSGGGADISSIAFFHP